MADAIELKRHLWSKLEQGPFIMLGLSEPRTHAEPLTAQLDADQVDRIYFFIGKDNRLSQGGPAMGQFVSKGQDYFACLAGTVTVDNDRTMIDKLWNKQAEAWFPGGKDDPNLALLRFDIDDAELWETDLSLGGRIKMLFGGMIRSDQSGSHARVTTTAA